MKKTQAKYQEGERTEKPETFFLKKMRLFGDPKAIK